jgi:putative ATP-binding cassette transporter
LSPARKPALTGRRLYAAIWSLVRIYWGSPDARVGALLLAGALALEMITVCGSVRIAVAERRIFDALGDRSSSDFLLAMGFFFGALAGFIVVSTYRIYLRQALEIRWRRGLTEHYLAGWMSAPAYWEAELHGDEIDNPDQRIAEDVRDFVASALGLPLSLVAALVTLFSFGGLLWAQGGSLLPISLGGSELRIPGLMLWVALGYALLSSWVTHLFGRRLVPLNFDRLRLEADFRYGLVRFRDNIEPVLLARGEELEREGARARFRGIMHNWRQLIRTQRDLTLLTSGIGQANGLIPVLLAAPAYFAGHLTLGGVAQGRIAYGQVSGALTWFVNAYQEIARWRANIERLSSLSSALAQTARDFERGGIQVQASTGPDLRVTDLEIRCPDGRALLERTSAAVHPGERISVTGPSGVGKTALLRVFAGIWPFGAGRIELPERSRMAFLSQRSYLPVGNLRAVVSYPSPEGSFPDERIAEALRKVDLGQLVRRLDESAAWDQQLSDHERQRLAIARVLLNQPEWIFMDRATSALDENVEARLYGLLASELPRSALISVAHRPSVSAHHFRSWNIAPGSGGCGVLQAA